MFSSTGQSLSGSFTGNPEAGVTYYVKDEATIGSDSYATVADALKAAEAGGTISLNYTCYVKSLSIDKEVIIDLNGHKLKGSVLDGNKGVIVADDTAIIVNNDGTVTLKPKEDQTITAPTVNTRTKTSVTLNPVAAGVSDTWYGYSETNDADTVSSWTTDVTFTGLTAGTTYYFFAKYSGDATHYEAVSSGTAVTTLSNKSKVEKDDDSDENDDSTSDIDTSRVVAGEDFVIDISSDKKAAETTVSEKSVEYLAQSKASGLNIRFSDADVTIDKTALKKIASALGGNDMTLSIKTGSDAVSGLSNDQKKKLSKLKNALVISASLTAGGKTISDLGGGTIEITVDYTTTGKGPVNAVFISEDGTIEIVPVTYKNGKATITLKHLSDYVIYQTEDSAFEDVDSDEYFYDAVLWAAEEGITSGTDDTHFSPSASCTRAQMVTFLWRAAGSPEPETSVNPFADVNTDDYYYDAVLWAVEKEITKGTTETSFSPDAVVKRCQAVTFLARMKGVKDDASGYSHSFKDVSESDYYNNAVAWAATNGITEGTSSTAFSPDDNCLRCQIVTFLYRCFK